MLSWSDAAITMKWMVLVVLGLLIVGSIVLVVFDKKPNDAWHEDGDNGLY